MHHTLELVVGRTEDRHSFAGRRRVTVGRTRDCDVPLDDESVSPRHCTIEARGDELLVTDLDSQGGTFVNERRVRTGRAHAGDTIRAGSTVIRVVVAHSACRPERDDRPHPVPSLPADAEDGPVESLARTRGEPTGFERLSMLSGAGGAGSDAALLLERARRYLTALHRVSEILASAADVDGLADGTLAAILDATDADRAALVLRRRGKNGDAEVAAARARGANVGTFSVSRTLVADVIEKGVPTFARDAARDDRFRDDLREEETPVRAVMCVPLRAAEEILGALYVDTISAPGRFAEPDLELLAAVGKQAGVALHRVRLAGELERLLIDTVRAIAATVDAKDGYTHRHSERVAVLAERIARELGLSADEQRTAYFAALLHDVGKIAVPDSILNKAGRLSEEEYEEMKKHPLYGAEILLNIKSAAVSAVLPGVQYHHEQWDGSGYPEGLSGETIPPLGRLLCVSDFFDAVTSARAYRAGVHPDEAIALLRRGAGTHFDPRMVEAAARLHARGELLPPNWDDLQAPRASLVPPGVP